MISCACDMETFDPYVNRTHRARKHHRCSDCGGTIVPGEQYRLHGGACDGSWNMYKRCADCEFLIHEVGRTFLTHCGGWSCIYCGELATSWDELCEALEDDVDWIAHARQVRRIAGMQRAACSARAGTIRWAVPDWTDPECIAEITEA